MKSQRRKERNEKNADDGPVKQAVLDVLDQENGDVLHGSPCLSKK